MGNKMKSLKLLSNALGVAILFLTMRALWAHELNSGFLFWYLLVILSVYMVVDALSVVVVVLEELSGTGHTHVGSCRSCGKRLK